MPDITVTVRKGDTLSSLALRYLGSTDRWPEIYHRNASAIAAAQRGEARTARGMTGPDWIFPGTVLRMPAMEKPHVQP
jgi:nucleoid-associated protein YgaU